MARVADEFNIVQPRIIVIMGEPAIGILNGLGGFRCRERGTAGR